MYCLENHIEALDSNIAEPSISFVVSEDTLLSLYLSTPIRPIQNFPGFYGDLNYKPAISKY